jgi:hypothetical protein
MRARRSQDLRSSLEHELRAVTVRDTLDSESRRRWLLDQLDNYLDRWLGFAAVGIPLKSLLRDDLFTMLIVGVDAYARELEAAAIASSELAAWEKFQTLLRQLQETRDGSNLPALRIALTSVRNALSTKPG